MPTPEAVVSFAETAYTDPEGLPTPVPAPRFDPSGLPARLIAYLPPVF